MDLLRSRGAAAFASRLRRLSERVDRDAVALYADRGLPFEPRWFATVVALRDFGPLSVGELARMTGVSHAAVSQVRSQLAAAGLVEAAADPRDGRRRTLALTADGRALAARCASLWQGMADATAALLEQHAPRLLAQLDALEAALDQLGIQGRVDLYDPPPTPVSKQEDALP
jgi:DNA-binding MarR family transcriptional regulator